MSLRLALGIGAVLALLPLAKGNGFFLYPAAAVGLAGVAWRHRPGARPFVAAAAAFALVCAVWIPFSLALHHDPLPTNPGWNAANPMEYPTQVGPAVETRAALDHPGQFASYLWEEFLPPLPGMPDVRPLNFPHAAYTAYVVRGWASFGFIAIQFPHWVYVAIAAALGAAALMLLAALVRERRGVRQRGWELGVLVLALLTVWIGSEAVYFVPRANSLSLFGRYLFVAIAALAVAAVGAGSQLLTMSSLYA